MSSPPAQKPFQASTPAPSTPILGGGGRKANAEGKAKKGKKSRAASTTPSVADSQAGTSTTIQWATPIQTSISESVGVPKGTPTSERPAGIPDGPLSAGVVASSAGRAGADDDGEGDEDLLPDMADDDYSAQLSWQSQSKDNLKWVDFSPEVVP